MVITAVWNKWRRRGETVQQEEEEIMTVRLEQTAPAAPSKTNEMPPKLSRRLPFPPKHPTLLLTARKKNLRI
jgi:hypothetical protein